MVLIPSTNHKTVNIELSFSFLLFIVSIFISFSFLLIYKVEIFENKSKISTIEKNSLEFLNKYETYHSYSKDLEKSLEETKKSLKSVYIAANGKEEDFNNSKVESIIEKITKKIKEQKNELKFNHKSEFKKKIHENVQKYNYLKKLIARQKNLLLTIENSTVKKHQILKSIPFGKPVRYYRLTSKYGYRKSPTSYGYKEFHTGIDMANFPGTHIYSTTDGVVEKVAYSLRGYGNHIIIRHANGFYTLYAHCKNVYVKQNQKVKDGDLIASIGSTGNVTGPHLHYEIWLGGPSQKINPLEYINVASYN